MTNAVFVAARKALRRAGLSSMLAALVYGRKYEEAYDNMMTSNIRPGDHLWDIGANHGLYTLKFVELTGPKGSIDCFEPSAKNLAILRPAIQPHPNIKLHEVGLSDQSGTVSFVQDNSASGVGNRITATDGESSDSEITVVRAEEVIDATPDSVPDVIKIDVEGHELHVLRGFGDCLKDTKIRCIGVEVHFSLLEAQGLSGAANQIESLLKAAGFKVNWTDPSHIVALR
ncbi:MAG: FkbM family methyltransferase [Pseudomonadota bacterium]